MRTTRLVFLIAFAAAANAVSATNETSSDVPKLSSQTGEARWRRELQQAQAPEIRAKLKELRTRPQGKKTARAFLVAVEILADKEGPAAFAAGYETRSPQISNRELVEATVRGLARRDADEAEKWFTALPSGLVGEDKTELTRALLAEESGASPAKAMQRGLRLGGEDISTQTNNALAVMEELSQLGLFEKAREIIETIENREVRQTVWVNLIGLTSDHRPDLAKAWLASLPPGTDRQSAVFRVCEGVANRDFSDAVSLFESLPPEERSLDLAESMISKANAIKASASDRLQNLLNNDEALHRVIPAILVRQHSIAPTRVDWALFGRLKNQAGRDALLRTLLLANSARDLSGTLKIIDDLTFLPPDHRAELSRIIQQRSSP